MGDAKAASGATETLVFSLTVDDGYPADAPAPGYTFADGTDSVVVGRAGRTRAC